MVVLGGRKERKNGKRERPETVLAHLFSISGFAEQNPSKMTINRLISVFFCFYEITVEGNLDCIQIQFFVIDYFSNEQLHL
uniref:Uncharacterized protein n=1 Tax=Caenorhabditis tropicalis TaxID=1561998 RepID=A0A1I7TQP4_9PELO